MSPDRHQGHPRPPRAPAWAGLVLALVLAPVASAQGSATATPPLVAPGAALTLTYRVAAPQPADLALQERVTCAIQGPSGEARPYCDASSGPVRVEVLPTETVYSFDVAAPAVLGEHVVTFARARTLDLLGPDASATVSFTVVAPPVASPDDPTPAGDDGGAGDPATPSGADGDSDADALRWLVSATLGTATLVALLVVGRGGLGGGLP